MPSPLAHLAFGAGVAHIFSRNVTDRNQRRKIWAAALFFSIAPDLDAIPGIITGNMPLYHNQMTHSIFFGITVCLLATFCLRPFFLQFLDWWSYPRIASLLLSAYGLHLAMDALTLGPGVKLLWPITDERFSAPFILFYGVRHSEGLLSHHHLITIANELGVIIGALFLVRILSRLGVASFVRFSPNFGHRHPSCDRWAGAEKVSLPTPRQTGQPLRSRMFW